MDITYLGQSSFKIKTKTGIVVIEDKTITVSHDSVGSVKKVVDGPGEYEISGVTIMGYKSGENTIYIIEAEGLRIVYLGDLGNLLNDDLIEEIGNVDVLMIPVGGSSAISKIEPYFVIPMLDEKSQSVESFLKESGLTAETLPKFSLKKEDILEEQNTKVIVLEKK